MAVGQVSADGQFRWDGTQWVPIPRGAREPTSWTRPMQRAVAGYFVVQAFFSLVTSAVYINHDTMLRALKAQGTQIPQGTDIETVLSISIFFAIAVVIVIAALELVAALGSYLRWRWMFWVALVLFGLDAISALSNIQYFSTPDASPIPTWGIVVSEFFALIGVGLFVWLLIAAIKFGPWAMKKPSA